MAEIKLREVLSKKAFTRITPMGYYMGGVSHDPMDNGMDNASWQIITQADFLREYYPSGHRINDPVYYPDKVRQDLETKKYYVEQVIRCAFPFQKIIATKQIIHLCGNDVRFELTEPRETQEQKDLFFNFKKGWQLKHTEYALYSLVKSIKVTGDGAVAGVISDGQFSWRNFSYLNGDKLFAHYDDMMRLKLFARQYKSYDEAGNEAKVFVEVWDDKNHYLFSQPLKGTKAKVIQLLGVFGLSGYTEVRKPIPHGFDFIPIAYFRSADGACWSDSQNSIDKYELAVSHLCQNNMAYAFPIMFLKGDSVNIVGGENIYAPVKAITGDSSSEASFLNTPDGSASFELQLKILLQNIFQGSFTVLPPELKSGDLPGVAVKLLYSPAIEKAMADASELDMTIADMVKIFAHGYGLEIGQMTPMKNLKINSWIEPYVHQNVAELMQNLLNGVQNEFLSKETAASLTPYGKNDEYYRIIKQQKTEAAMTTPEDINLNTIP